MENRSIATFVCCLAVVMAMPCAVRAESKIEEIVVTATKREELARDLPGSFSVFRGEELKSLGLETSTEIADQIPNLQLKSEFGGTTLIAFMRGVGNRQWGGHGQNPVSLYTDSIYMGARAASGLSLFDLERVEVLRGPQGTLFGRNATGGLVNFITRKPVPGEAMNGYVTLTAGTFEQFNVDAAGGLPLGETAAARVAFNRQQNDGYTKNVNPDIGVKTSGPVDDRTSYRGQLAWMPSDDLDILLNFHGAKSRGLSAGIKASGLVCPPGVAVPGAFENRLICTAFDGSIDAPGIDETRHGLSSFEDVDTWGVNTEINWRLGDYTVTAIGAYDDTEMRRLSEDDASPSILLDDSYTDLVDTWSTELRIASEYNGPTNWLAGLYYYGDKLDTGIYNDATDFQPAAFAGAYYNVVHQETDTWAAFGSLTHEFWDHWTFRAGVRYTEDIRRASIQSGLAWTEGMLDIAGPPPAGIDPLPNFVYVDPLSGAVQDGTFFEFIPFTTFREKWGRWSGDASLTYRFNDDHMVYASGGRGFKGGEFNGQAITRAAQALISDPEYVTNIEVGHKGSWMNDSLLSSVTFYYMMMDDRQTVAFPPPGTQVRPTSLLLNAGEIEIKGVEWELGFQPNANWFFKFAGAYLDTEVTDTEPGVTVGNGTLMKGKELPESPKWSLNGLVRYEQPVGNGIFALQADWRYQTKAFFTIENDAAWMEDAYGVVGLRGSYRFLNDRVELALHAKNLFDERYIMRTHSGSFGAVSGSLMHIVSPPRQILGSISISYD